jgi:hypothetical protein
MDKSLISIECGFRAQYHEQKTKGSTAHPTEQWFHQSASFNGLERLKT